MSFTFLGPETSIYKDYIEWILNNNYSIRDFIKDTLWIELDNGIEEKKNFEGKIKEFLDKQSVKKIRLILPSTDMCSNEPVFIYEMLSYVIETAQKKGLNLYYLPLTQDISENRKRITLLIIDHVQPGENEKEERKIYDFRGNIIYWDPQSLLLRAASGSASWILEVQKNKEEVNLPDDIRQWKDNPSSAFEQLNERWVNDMTCTIRNYNLLTGWWRFVSNFGAGRNERRFEHLANILNPDFNRNLFETLMSGNQPILESVYILFPPPQYPPEELLQQVRRLRRYISTFYYPEIGDLNDIRSINFEETPSDNLILQTKLWERELMPLLSRLNNLLQQINSQLTQQLSTRRERRRAMRQLRRNIRTQLREVRNGLTHLVDEEIREVMSRDNIFDLSPERFQMAYREFYAGCFSTILGIFNLLWGLRTFLGFPLSRRFPSFIYPLKGYIRYAIAILRQAIRLLNFYQMICLSLMRYRNMIHDFYQEYSALLSELPGYKKHMENILKELEIHSSKVMHRKFNFEDIDIKRIMKSPDIFPEADSIIEEFKKKTYPKIEEINSLIATSRGSEGMIEQMSPLKVFIPAYFHKREAWNLGNKMAETISKDQDFENIFISYMNKYGLSSKNFVPYYAITKQQILNLEEDKFIRKWKKKALESAQSPLIIDILKPYPQEIESDIDFIISRGIDTGYWKRNDDGLLGLCKEVFVWTSEKIRTIFFQRILGLSKNEIRKANSSQAEELSKWFLWFVNREKIYFESPEEYSFLYKSPSPDFIIDTVICKYGGIPPHHDYFGTLELVDNTYFMLLNTYNHRLMELFKPERIEDCRTRFFTERQIKSYLSKERILQEFLGLFFNYALVRELDEIIHEFVERKLFSC